MPELLELPLSDILIDAQNPRLLQPNVGQRDALRAIAHHQGKRLPALAKDIVDYGLNPAELSIVMPLGDMRNKYVILEGNRRLTALRALENPDIFVDAITAGALNQLRKLSRRYQAAPIDSIPCVIVKDREEARHWIELRHTGFRGGAGLIPWSSEDTARFRARGGPVEAHLQALDFLESRGDLTPEERRKVPVTSFKRLIGTPAVRAQLGIEVREGRVKALAGEQYVAKALLHVARDLASRKTKVTDIYTQPQREAYAAKLPADIRVATALPSGHGVDLTVGGIHVRSARKTVSKAGRVRDKLIPRDCTLSVTEPRLHDIETELRKLSLEDHTNAVSVLFRVFVELSADSYIDQYGITLSNDPSLRGKLQQVTNDLIAKKKPSNRQAAPVRRACEKDSFLAPSVTLMHAWIHNQYIFPVPGDLRRHWDNLEPFVTAMWAP
ncbi:MAG TPA: hypothetical protein VG206_18965 [Terriglobia bacterium]|nr:hypothetical protein [Terriglobia bacterium]